MARISLDPPKTRAVTLYEFVDSRLAAGDQFLIRRKDTGGLELVQFS